MRRFDPLGSEIGFVSQDSPCSSKLIPYSRSQGICHQVGKEAGESWTESGYVIVVMGQFPIVSLWIRETIAETSSHQTPPTAIKSAEAETFTAQPQSTRKTRDSAGFWPIGPAQPNRRPRVRGITRDVVRGFLCCQVGRFAFARDSPLPGLGKREQYTVQSAQTIASEYDNGNYATALTLLRCFWLVCVDEDPCVEYCNAGPAELADCRLSSFGDSHAPPPRAIASSAWKRTDKFSQPLGAFPLPAMR